MDMELPGGGPQDIRKPNYLEQALCTLNDIGTEMSRLHAGQDLASTLRAIAENVVRALGAGRRGERSISATVYAYDADRGAFDLDSRVVAGDGEGPVSGDAPRVNGMGVQAVQKRRRVLSYDEPELSIHQVKVAAGARTVACYPLVVADRPVGVLYVSLRQKRRFTSQELLILDNYVLQAAMALHNVLELRGMGRSLQRKIEELEKLRRADQVISSRLRLDETLEEILHITLQMTGARYGSFRLLDKARGQLILASIAGAGPGESRGPLSIGESSVMGWAAVHKAPARIADLRKPPWSRIYRPLTAGQEMRSELVVPLLGAGGALEGVLNVESPAVGAFSQDDQRLLEALATQAVIAIQEIKLLDAMQDIASNLLTLSRQGLFELIIRRACDLISVPIAAIWTLAPGDPDTMVLQWAGGGHRRGDTLPVADSMTGRAVLRGKPVTSPDVRADPRFLYRDLARAQGWVSALIVPLLARDGAAFGAFSLYTTEPRLFSDWDKRLLICLAAHAAIAIQDAERLAELKSAQERQAVAETFAAVGDVTANLLHRLDNAVGAIPVRVREIRERSPDALTGPLAEGLGAIQRHADEAVEYVTEALTHLQPASPQPTPVAPCLAEALQMLEVPPQVQFIQTGLSDLPPVMAGERQLTLVFLNLLENALEAMGGEGILTVRGWVADGGVEVAVADTGRGIPEALHDKIFDPDFSKHTRGRRGFGLWWVRTFVQRFGGAIGVTSTPGLGSIFTLRLPAVTDEMESEDAVTGARAPQRVATGTPIAPPARVQPTPTRSISIAPSPVEKTEPSLQSGVPLPELTERQREVLILLAQGLSNKDIAEALVITPNTVKKHVHNIFNRLGVSNRAAAASRTVQAGLVSDA